MALLAKAVGKFPAGTANRWGKIAAFLNNGATESEIAEAAGRVSHKPEQPPISTVDWTNAQQTELEAALGACPPGAYTSPDERWADISTKVSGKSPEDCLARFKQIRDAIRSANQ